MNSFNVKVNDHASESMHIDSDSLIQAG